jgi:hypothetical protein
MHNRKRKAQQVTPREKRHRQRVLIRENQEIKRELEELKKHVKELEKRPPLPTVIDVESLFERETHSAPPSEPSSRALPCSPQPRDQGEEQRQRTGSVSVKQEIVLGSSGGTIGSCSLPVEAAVLVDALSEEEQYVLPTFVSISPGVVVEKGDTERVAEARCLSGAVVRELVVMRWRNSTAQPLKEDTPVMERLAMPSCNTSLGFNLRSSPFPSSGKVGLTVSACHEYAAFCVRIKLPQENKARRILPQLTQQVAFHCDCRTGKAYVRNGEGGGMEEVGFRIPAGSKMFITFGEYIRCYKWLCVIPSLEKIATIKGSIAGLSGVQLLDLTETSDPEPPSTY